MVADSGFWIKCSSRCTMFQNGFIPSSLSTICLALVIGPKNAQKNGWLYSWIQEKLENIQKLLKLFHIFIFGVFFSTSPIGFLQMAEEFFKNSTGIPTGITIRFSKKNLHKYDYLPSICALSVRTIYRIYYGVNMETRGSSPVFTNFEVRRVWKKKTLLF